MLLRDADVHRTEYLADILQLNGAKSLFEELEPQRQALVHLECVEQIHPHLHQVVLKYWKNSLANT